MQKARSSASKKKAIPVAAPEPPAIAMQPIIVDEKKKRGRKKTTDSQETLTQPTQPIQPIQPIQSQTQSITMQQLYNKIIELEQSMNAKHAEIMEYLHGLNVKGGQP
jgi:hypothetical protein